MGFLLPGITLTGSAPASPMPKPKQRHPQQQHASTVSPHPAPQPPEGLQQQATSSHQFAPQQQPGSVAGCHDSAARSPDPALLAALHCPLTGSLLQDPVLAADGYTYERSAVQAWLVAAGGAAAVSPMTGQPLTSHAIRTNHAVRQLLDSLVGGGGSSI